MRDAEAFALAGFKEYEAAARALKIQLQSLEVRGPDPDLEGAFQAARKGNARAVITITNSPLFRNSKRIADLAIKHRLPSMFEGTTWVENGGLMSYSANDLAAYFAAPRHSSIKYSKVPNQPTYRSSNRRNLSL